MIEFIPLKYYKSYYYFILFFLIFLLFLNSKMRSIFDGSNLKKINVIGFVILIFILTFIGLRPINGRYFGDTETYDLIYKSYSTNSNYHLETGDFLFDYLMRFLSNFLDINSFFLICAFIYIYSIYFSTKKIFKEYWTYPFVILVISLSFWSYGVNGVRNGIATSLFIYALTRSTIKSQLLWMLIGIGFHKSLILPIVGYLITLKVKSSRSFLIFWVFCIPFSLLIGSSFQDLISAFFDDNKLDNYFYNENTAKQFSKIGFRWDFLLYSCLGVFSGFYFIVRRKFKDLFYEKIYSIYLFSNAIWILVIKSSFSNRFAYLSWFMMGLIIVYPFFKQLFFNNQYKLFGNILLIYFLITFILDFILIPN